MSEEVVEEEIEVPTETEESAPVETTKEEEYVRPTPEDSVLEAIQIAKGEKIELAGEAVEPEKVRRSDSAPRDGEPSTGEDNADPKKDAAEEDIPPPQRLSAEGKEWFLKLPKEGKREYAAAITHLEGLATKTLQEARRAESEAKDVIDAVKPFLNEWGAKGISAAQAIRQLCAANANLRDRREDAVIDLCRSMKIDPKIIAAKLDGKTNGSAPSSDPHYQSLTNELNQLKSWKQQQEALVQEAEQQRTSQSAQAIAQEINAVRSELGPGGKFKYPKLHDAQYLAQIEPLIFNLWQTHAGKLSWADATKRAYHAVEGTPSPSPQGSRLPSASNKQEIERAKAASVSVKGRGAAPLLALDTKSVPRKAEDTVRMVLEHLRRE